MDGRVNLDRRRDLRWPRCSSLALQQLHYRLQLQTPPHCMLFVNIYPSKIIFFKALRVHGLYCILVWEVNEIEKAFLLCIQNLKFVAMNKTVVRRITSVNSKLFHIALVGCHNFKGSKIKISAPANSPNTDGIHVERSSSVYFSRSHIGTGDDCISIGQGNSQVTITSISCGPGHGIRYLKNPLFPFPPKIITLFTHKYIHVYELWYVIA